MNRFTNFRSLFYKIGAPSVLVCIVVFIFIAYFFRQENAQFIHKNIDNEISHIENTLSISLEGDKSTSNLRRVVSALGSGKSISRLVLIDRNSGKIIADTQSGHLEKNYSSVLALEELQTIQTHMQSNTRSVISRDHEALIASSIGYLNDDANQPRSYLFFMIYDKTIDLENANRNLSNIIIILTIGLLVLLFLMYLVQHYALLKPIQKIIQSIIAQVESNELLTLQVDSNGELGILAKHCDELSVQKNLKDLDMQELTLRMEVAIDATALGVFEFDVRSDTHIWNKRMYEILGLDESEFKPSVTSWSDRIHPEDKKIVENKLLDSVRTGSSFTHEYRIVQPSNTICTVRTFVQTVSDANEKATRLVGTLLDITEQTLLSKQREDALIKAEESARLKSEFLASVSHEIRTPMNGVIGMIDLMLKSTLNKKQLQYAQLAKGSAESLLKLINDVLDFSKIDAGKLELDLVNFNLQEMLGNCVELLAIKAQEKNVEIILDTTSISHHLVLGDPARLGQIITNLIANAIKFTDAGEIVIAANTTSLSDGSLNFFCTISDTGIGIPNKDIPNLFESFTQVDASTTRKYGGTGLGLAIVKQLCSIMGGEVNITSEVGKGSCVSFNIHMSKCEKLAVDFKNLNFTSHKILLVENNSTSRKVITKQLEKFNCEVDAVANASDALDKLKNKDYSFIFISQKLSDMSCFKLGDQIRQLPNQTTSKLILMSNLSDLNILEESSNLDFSLSISKPITHTKLIEVFCDLEPEKYPRLPELIAAPAVGSGTEATIKILLVEDNAINQAVVIGLLENYNLKVVSADNGLEALKELANSKYDDPFELILMDCQMPELDGYQTTQRIRSGDLSNNGEHYKDISIIALTANAVLGDREKCIDSGMNDYITKPINSNLLINLLHHFLPNMHVREYTCSSNEIGEPLSHQSDANNGLKIWDKKLVLNRIGGKPERLNQLIELFLKNTPSLLSNLENQIKNLSGSEIAKTAHTIKGSAGNISGVRLYETASKIEVAAKLNAQSEIEVLLPNLIEDYKVLANVLEQEKQRRQHY